MMPYLGRLKIGTNFMKLGMNYLRIGPVASKQPGYSHHAGSHYNSGTDTTEPDFTNPLVGYDLPVLMFLTAGAVPSGDLTWASLTTIVGTHLTLTAWIATIPAAMGAGVISIELDRTCDWMITTLDGCDAVDPIVQSAVASVDTATAITATLSAALTGADLAIVAAFGTGNFVANLTVPAGWTILNQGTFWQVYYGLPITATATWSAPADTLCAIILEPESL